MGTQLFRQSRYEETLAVAERALELAERRPDAAPEVLHRARKLRGDALSGATRYAQALESYRTALRLSRDALPARVSRDLRSLANVEACLGRNDDAERHLGRALRSARDAREPAAALHALVQRGRLARLENDDALADRCLRVAATHPSAEARDARLVADLLGEAAGHAPFSTSTGRSVRTTSATPEVTTAWITSPASL